MISSLSITNLYQMYRLQRKNMFYQSPCEYYVPSIRPVRWPGSQWWCLVLHLCMCHFQYWCCLRRDTGLYHSLLLISISTQLVPPSVNAAASAAQRTLTNRIHGILRIVHYHRYEPLKESQVMKKFMHAYTHQKCQATVHCILCSS